MAKEKEVIWMAQAVLQTDGMTFEEKEVSGEWSMVNKSFPMGTPLQ
jgi:hypothetical protein